MALATEAQPDTPDHRTRSGARCASRGAPGKRHAHAEGERRDQQQREEEAYRDFDRAWYEKLPFPNQARRARLSRA